MKSTANACSKLRAFVGIILLVLFIFAGNQHVEQRKQEAFDNFSCAQHGNDCASFTSCKQAFMAAYSEHSNGGH